MFLAVCFAVYLPEVPLFFLQETKLFLRELQYCGQSARSTILRHYCSAMFLSLIRATFHMDCLHARDRAQAKSNEMALDTCCV